jgi:hypothetical protein
LSCTISSWFCQQYRCHRKKLAKGKPLKGAGSAIMGAEEGCFAPVFGGIGQNGSVLPTRFQLECIMFMNGCMLFKPDKDPMDHYAVKCFT